MKAPGLMGRDMVKVYGKTKIAKCMMENGKMGKHMATEWWYGKMVRDMKVIGKTLKSMATVHTFFKMGVTIQECMKMVYHMVEVSFNGLMVVITKVT